MWGQKNKSTTISDFYNGDNIFKELNDSLFGKIHKIFKQVFTDNTEKNYQLPKVIVIGTESSGKSSLLERITKCQLFPRDGKLCTKCPIKVRLENGKSSYSIQLPGDKIQQIKNKKDIYPIIQKYMNSLPNECISEDEILIKIVDNDISDFEFYDLPGIRTYPQESATLSLNICKKYLSDKNSIVLCVVPCTTTRLTSCQSIALITETNMEQNTILALTMTDRLQPENIEELLINRIINNTDELKNIKFANCIAVVNRSHSDKYSLEQCDKIEQAWFDENIYQCIPPEHNKHKKKINNNTKISNLLDNMNNLYNKFIQTNWIPNMLLDMHSKEVMIKKEIDKLGKIVTCKEDYTINQIKTVRLETSLNDILSIKFDILPTGLKMVNSEGNKWFTNNFKSVRDFIYIQINSIFKNLKITYEFNDIMFDGPTKRFANLTKEFGKIILNYSEIIFAKEKMEYFKNNYINYSINTCVDNTSKELLTYLESLFFRIFHDLNDDIRMLWSELAVKDFAESDEWKEKRLKLKTEETHILKNINIMTGMSKKLNE
jgi:GTP-binding protein EngB required for normal cell division